MLVVIFQTQHKEKLSAKKFELDAAKSNHENAKAELGMMQIDDSEITQQAL